MKSHISKITNYILIAYSLIYIVACLYREITNNHSFVLLLKSVSISIAVLLAIYCLFKITSIQKIHPKPTVKELITTETQAPNAVAYYLNAGITIFCQSYHYKALNEKNKSQSNEEFSLPSTERNQIQEAICTIFKDLFYILKENNPKLSREDLLSCVFIHLDLSPRLISNCLGVSQDAFRKRKSRIKNKMNDEHYSLFFS